MPTLLRYGGYRFYFFSHEPNEPPHIHVDKGNATIKVWLATLEVARNRGFRTHEIAGIIAIISDHQRMFVEKWHEYFG
ncbi:MAG: DUF4160 domain-containing protein [Sphingomonadales bacterium]|nr:DUF4160 domain-containing protein [Sphingomonadales bacterium]MBK8273563.1 DUF4160 domain-containing protein [Sphingomonadales bacterium]MBK8859914.1 DUF4160 domain-containing protein [Sphingomonadales bacterium]